mmetsp:Transcript_56847/g.144151  ORF Transcript_56847/g.144151 Transcript_56847/m.144151 type:complete len:222 (-) Transcript_56847:553-1218(-)
MSSCQPPTIPQRGFGSTSWVNLATAGFPSSLEVCRAHNTRGNSFSAKTWLSLKKSAPNPNLSYTWSLTMPSGFSPGCSAWHQSNSEAEAMPVSVLMNHTIRFALRCSIASTPESSMMLPSPSLYSSASCRLMPSCKTGQILAEGSKALEMDPATPVTIPANAALETPIISASVKGTEGAGTRTLSPPVCCSGAEPPKAKVWTRPPPTTTPDRSEPNHDVAL